MVMSSEILVPEVGVEPTRLAATPPQDVVSAIPPPGLLS